MMKTVLPQSSQSVNSRQYSANTVWTDRNLSTSLTEISLEEIKINKQKRNCKEPTECWLCTDLTQRFLAKNDLQPVAIQIETLSE